MFNLLSYSTSYFCWFQILYLFYSAFWIWPRNLSSFTFFVYLWLTGHLSLEIFKVFLRTLVCSFLYLRWNYFLCILRIITVGFQRRNAICWIWNLRIIYFIFKICVVFIAFLLRDNRAKVIWMRITSIHRFVFFVWIIACIKRFIFFIIFIIYFL